MASRVSIVRCGREYSEAILAILNEAIVTSTALYDYEPRTPAMMDAWFAAREAGGYPIIGALDGNGQLLGFGTYGEFRARPACKYTVEHSVYVDVRHRGQGLGKTLLQAVIDAATAADLHCLMAGVDGSNEASKKLHLALGFTLCGTLREVGYKFGEWLDLEFYQLLLPTPAAPADG